MTRGLELLSVFISSSNISSMWQLYWHVIWLSVVVTVVLNAPEALGCVSRVATNLGNLEYSGITHGFLWTWKTHGILREFCATSGKNCNKQSVFSSLSFKYLCKTAVDWVIRTLGTETRSECGGDLLYWWSWCGMTLNEGHYYIYFFIAI